MLLTTYHVLGSHAPLLCNSGVAWWTTYCSGGLSSWGCTGLTAAEAAPCPKTVRWSPWPSCPAASASLRGARAASWTVSANTCLGTAIRGSPGSNSQIKERKHSLQSPEGQRQEARTPVIRLHSPYAWLSQLRQYSPAPYIETRKGQSNLPRVVQGL